MLPSKVILLQFGVRGVKIPAVLQERASSEEPIQLGFNPQGQIRLFNRLLFWVKLDQREVGTGNSDPFLCSFWPICQACPASLGWTRDGGFIAGGRIELSEFACSCECVFVLHQQFLTEHQDVNVLFVHISWSYGQTVSLLHYRKASLSEKWCKRS